MQKLLHDLDGQLSFGQPAPEFNLPGVDDKNHALADYTGKVKAMVVIFSCNHCPWVIKYEGRMNTIAREYTSKGVGFVVISSNDVTKYPQDNFDRMKERAHQKSYSFPYLFDESQDVARDYGALVTPHVFLFDSEMKLQYRGAIDDNPEKENRKTNEFLRNAIDAILSGKGDAIELRNTKAVGCSVKWK